MPDTQTTPTLDYRNPRVFYEGKNDHRSPAYFVIAPMILGFGLFAAWIAIFLRQHEKGLLWNLAEGIAALFALLLFSLAGKIAWDIVTGLKETVRVTEDGIAHHKRRFDWSTIATVYAIEQNKGVCLHLTTVRAPLLYRPLQTTPSTSMEDFANLVRDLTPFLAERYPHVKFDPVPRKPTSG